MSKVIIIVPCYNEASRLKLPLFEEFLAQNQQFSFLFVDDGSSDSTAQLIAEASQRNSRVLLHRLPQNQGKAEAVRAGVLRGIELFPQGELFGYFDADLATPLAELKNFVSLMEAGQSLLLVMAARVKLLGHKVDRSLRRHYLSRVFATFASALLQIPVYDTQCGAKLFRRSASEFVFKDSFKSRWLFDVELLLRFIQYLQLQGRTRLDIEYFALELPVLSWINARGSKIRASDLAKCIIDVFKILQEKKQRLGSFWLSR